MDAAIHEKLEGLPRSPGVYIFYGNDREVLYVGKAKDLRSRVRSYFQSGSSDNRIFIPLLQTEIRDLETFLAGSEKEAVVLENNLIKEKRPRFNVKLRDDKEYLLLRIPSADPWPRLYAVRQPGNDGARYFGPYPSASAARKTQHLVNKHFQLRTCSDSEFASRKRPCLQYQIKRCPAPCVYEVDENWYREQVRSVELFLVGKHDELSEELEVKMAKAAEQLQFELAAVYRDQLRAIRVVQQSQRILTDAMEERDVVGLYRDGDRAEISVLRVRRGKLFDVAAYSFKDVQIEDAELLGGFVVQHYEPRAAEELPKEVLMPINFEGIDGIGEWLSERASHRVRAIVPSKGDKRALVELANENALHAFAEKKKRETTVQEKLESLRDVLRLQEIPRSIECCDISHLGGGDSVGAIVAMRDGALDKKRYRTFRVRGREGVSPELQRGDDYGAMYEVLARRFFRAKENEQKSDASDAAALTTDPLESEDVRTPWQLPDLLVVDGGRGQLGVAQAAANDLGLHTLAIVGLAKEKENVRGDALVDRIYLPGQKNPIAVRAHLSLGLLTQLRDEAHRFSNKGRMAREKKRVFRSELDDIPKIGKATRQKLLTHFGTVDGVFAASDEELLSEGLNRAQLATLREHRRTH